MSFTLDRLRIAQAIQAMTEDGMQEKIPAVYIMASKRHGTLYIGVSSNLPKRVYEHRNHVIAGFTEKYRCVLLVYYEVHDTMESAIHREKRLKKYTRAAKLALIESFNPEWKDLYETIIP